MDKIKIIKIKSPDNWKYLELFFVYSPINHNLAHLWEHLLFRKLDNDKEFLIEKASTGSGIMNIKIKTKKDLKNIESILKIENKYTEIEKKRIESEIREQESKEKLFYQTLQNQGLNHICKIKELKLPKQALKIFNLQSSFVVIASPNLKEDLVNLKNIQIVKEKDKIPNLIKSRDTSLHQLNVRVKIKNELEANFLLMLLPSLYSQVEQKLKNTGIYRVNNDLFKGYSKSLFFNFSFYDDQKNKLNNVLKIIKKINIKINKDYKIKLIKELDSKNNLEKLEYQIWQILEWGNYTSIKNQIKKIEELTNEKLNAWWKNKDISFFKVEG